MNIWARLACSLLVPGLVACAGAGTAVRTSEIQREAPDIAETSVTGKDASLGTSKSGSPKGQDRGPDSIGRFENGRAMDHVRSLAGDIGVRVRATRGERRGIMYVKRQLEKIGYRTDAQKFSVDGGKSRNLVAWWPTAGKNSFVVGAHMDTVHKAPGANDNASGTAVMLETARIFAGSEQSKWLRFVSFGSEEYGSNGVHHVGSHKYVRRLGNKGRNRVAGMVSVDMIADGKPLIIGNAGIGPLRLAKTIFRKLRRTNIGVDYQQTCDCSDNGPFEIAGIPASFMWSGFEPNYHDSSDTVENMKPKHMRRTGRAVRIFLQQLDSGMISNLRDT